MTRALFSGPAESLGPGVADDDLPDFSEQMRRIYELLRDGHWHSREAIQDVSGAQEATRRVRELRKYYDIECKQFGRRCFKYRLLGPAIAAGQTRQRKEPLGVGLTRCRRCRAAVKIIDVKREGAWSKAVVDDPRVVDDLPHGAKYRRHRCQRK